MRTTFFHGITICWLFALRLVVFVAPLLGLPLLLFRPKRPRSVIALTGTFYSENWLVAHIKPIANSACCEKVVVVSYFDMPDMNRVVHVRPPEKLRALVGQTGARLLTFAGVCFRHRPDIVGGFHFLFNGMLAMLLARLVWAKSLYFCVGGEAEFLGGGLRSENQYFERLQRPNATVQKQLLSLAGGVDLIVTMGTGAKQFLVENSRARRIEVIPGFVNVSEERLRSVLPGEEREFDIIFVGRFSPIKRLDILLDAIDLMRVKNSSLKAVLVGRGELSQWVERRVSELGLEQTVQLAGFQKDPSQWLGRARITALCSDSEGLSLALMESCYMGLPAVISHVGDLPDLVESGVNGYLVSERTPQAFSDAMLKILDDRDLYGDFSRQSAQRAKKYALGETRAKWDNVISAMLPTQQVLK